jgi:hypothetical protein
MTQRRLILNWQVERTRKIVPVAELVVTTADGVDHFEFGYLEGARRASVDGFRPLMAFPEFGRRYASNELFPFFHNRVLPTTRPDYVDYVTALNLDPEMVDHVDLLGRGNGRRQTDRVETVLSAERDEATGRYVTRFLLRGVRHVQHAEDAIATIRAGDTLTAVIEPENQANPRARALVARTATIGWVPDYLVADLDALQAGDAAPSFIVERVNPPPHPTHQRVLVRLEADWPEGFEPFDAPEFRRYGVDDSPGSLQPTG